MRTPRAENGKRLLKRRVQVRPRRVRYGVVMICITIVMLVSGVLLWWQHSSQSVTTTLPATLQPGAVAADIQLAGIDGQTFHLRDYRGKPVLLSFLSTVPDTLDTPSRRQEVSLASMRQQYSARGLQVVIVDETGLEGGDTPSLNTLINVSYDWHLGQLQLVQDTQTYTAAHLYAVQHTPTTFLIAADGTIAQRWDGIALSAQLALNIQRLLQ